ncbi:MAG TPA: hypothetical protein DHM37_04595, partial [Candidatus Cloacimonas sp.]|nr:hypothetical protein [Candidatus Cloacimonas sp.]
MDKQLKGVPAAFCLHTNKLWKNLKCRKTRFFTAENQIFPIFLGPRLFLHLYMAVKEQFLLILSIILSQTNSHKFR